MTDNVILEDLLFKGIVHICLVDSVRVIKGNVSVISSDSSCKDDNAWFTTVPLKPFSDQ